jgi:hypothetical protein
VSTSNDPVKAWQEMVDQLSKTAAGSETPEFLQAMFASDAATVRSSSTGVREAG